MKYSGFLKEHSQVLTWVLRGIDLLVTSIACFFARFIAIDRSPIEQKYLVAFFLSLLAVSILFPLLSVYRTWRGASTFEESKVIFIAWSTVFSVLAVISVITKTSGDYSRLWFGLWFLFGFGGLLISRWIVRGFLAYIRENGLNQRSVVIVGASELGQHVASKIKSSPWYGYKIVGFFSDIETPELSSFLSDVPILGNTKQLSTYLKENSVDQVWIAMSMGKSSVIRRVLAELDTETVDVRYVPDIFSFNLLNHSVTEVADIPVINVSVTPMDGFNRFVKAVEDRVFASIILILISPIMLILAMMVKITSPGPIFYKQERVSWNGDTFSMLKFRSMPVNTEDASVKWGGANEKVVHPFGKFIRSTSLDELPQFINVLLGDMSIVGPRPERTIFVEQFKHEIPGYMKKHKVKAGITGWAQINGWRGDTDLKKRIECDLYYIENWSIWFDLKIIFLTLFKGFVHKNAH